MGQDTSLPSEAEAAAARINRSSNNDFNELQQRNGKMGQASGKRLEELPEFLFQTKSGYRILAIQDHSPACNEGIVPMFDFIVEADGRPLLAEDGTFTSIIKEFENRQLKITLYNCKCQQLRNVTFVPSRNWGGEGLLGLTIKYDSFEGIEDKVIHILDVKPNSPAEKSGLIAHSDYLLGTPYMMFEELDDLYDIVGEALDDAESGMDSGIEIYAYNTETDTVRRLNLCPSKDWGGEGVLGCGIGHGYLHRLPAHCQNTIGKSRKEDLVPLPNRGNMNSAEAKEDHTEQDSIAEDEEEIVVSRLVETSMGQGTLCGKRANGMYVVILDWNLPNGAIAMGYFQRENIEKAHEKPAEIIHVDLKSES